jgi:hypothetical protein
LDGADKIVAAGVRLFYQIANKSDKKNEKNNARNIHQIKPHQAQP